MDTLQVNADRLIARLRDKLAELLVQNALLETALEEANMFAAGLAGELAELKNQGSGTES